MNNEQQTKRGVRGQERGVSNPLAERPGQSQQSAVRITNLTNLKF